MKSVYIVCFVVLASIFSGCEKEPVADFEFPDQEYVAPAEVSFTNLSTDVDAYRWEFGDGSSSHDKNPVHTFLEGGTFDVTLYVKGKGGEDEVTKQIIIYEPQKTSYIFQNKSSYDLYNVLSFYWDAANSEILDEYNLGNIPGGWESAEIFPVYFVIDVAFEDAFGNLYLLDYSYELTPGYLNNLIFDDDTDYSLVPISKGTGKAQLREILNASKNRKTKVVKDLH